MRETGALPSLDDFIGSYGWEIHEDDEPGDPSHSEIEALDALVHVTNRGLVGVTLALLEVAEAIWATGGYASSHPRLQEGEDKKT